MGGIGQGVREVGTKLCTREREEVPRQMMGRGYWANEEEGGEAISKEIGSRNGEWGGD